MQIIQRDLFGDNGSKVTTRKQVNGSETKNELTQQKKDAIRRQRNKKYTTEKQETIRKQIAMRHKH